MRISNKIFYVLITCVIFSCTDLDEDTSSILSLGNISTQEELSSIVAPIYREMSEVYRLPFQQMTPTFGADDITTWIAGNKGPFRVFDGFDYGNGENSTGDRLQYGWDRYWKVIYYCNNLLSNIDLTSSEQFIKIGEGEARLFRALAYFHLVRIHGNMPIILDSQSPTGKEERATVLENYKHIENDLILAQSLLPSYSEVGSKRASSELAKTILAHLYLTWGGWPVKDESKYELAANTSKEVIDSGLFELLPIDELWLLENENSRESIFSIQYSLAENFSNSYPIAYSFHESRGFSDCFPELQFFNDFPEGPRKNATFEIDIPQRGLTDGIIVSLDPPTVPWQESQREHPMYKKFTISANLTYSNLPTGFRAMEVYRYAEVLLIYAESQARAGSNEGSVEAFNKVKRRAAGKDYLVPDATTDVLSVTPNEVVDERGWEMAGEYSRWFDLIRTESLEEVASRRDPAEPVQLVRLPGKDQYIAPIPSNAILTSNLQQNPAGFKIK